MMDLVIYDYCFRVMPQNDTKLALCDLILLNSNITVFSKSNTTIIVDELIISNMRS